jgi:NADH:ubiquinone oxidoreductase subunit 2 (subunit N)
LLVFNSAIGAYYYLRLLITFFHSTSEEGAESVRPQETLPQWGAIISLGLTASLVLWLGLYPQPMIAFVKDLVVSRGQ